MVMFLCPRCGKELPQAEFYNRDKDRDCKVCVRVKRREARALRGEEMNQLARKRYAADPERFRQQRKEYVSRNHERVLEAQRRWWAVNGSERRSRLDPRQVKDWHLQSRYGISIQQYEAMYEEQEGICPICLEWYEVLAVDHDHLTGKVRRLLCILDNSALGMFHDDPDRVLRAAMYLDEFEVKENNVATA